VKKRLEGNLVKILSLSHLAKIRHSKNSFDFFRLGKEVSVPKFVAENQSVLGLSNLMFQVTFFCLKGVENGKETFGSFCCLFVCIVDLRRGSFCC